MSIIDEFKAYRERYPGKSRLNFAHAVAYAAANNDPDYIRESKEIENWEKATNGARFEQEDRLLFFWRRNIYENWQEVYDRKHAEVLSQLGDKGE